jgi:DNA-binding transcriptional regulator YiaG
MTPAELRDWMAAHGHSVRGLAALLEVSPSTVQAWRDGTYAIPPYLWRALKHLEQHPGL